MFSAYVNIFRINDIIITLQPLMLNGKSGAIGPNARPLVVRGQDSGAAPAVNLSLEAMTSVLEMRHK